MEDIDTEGLEKMDKNNFLVLKVGTYEIWTDKNCFTVGRQSEKRGREKGLMQPSYHPSLAGSIKKISELTLKDRLRQKSGPDKTETLESLLTTIKEHDEWLKSLIPDY